MKTNTIIKLAALLFTFNFSLLTAFAQSPEKMTYQAVIRNASDQLVTNQGIGMQISILQGSATGTDVYVETHNTTTNANGLVSVEIGNGTVVSGDFSAIDWANDVFFIKTETDPTTAGGTVYTITGTSQLLSVPYALHAKTAESFTETDPVFTGSEAVNITASDITNLSNLSGINTGDQDGSETNVTAGTNISVSGTGTAADPYVVSKQTYQIGDFAHGGIVFWVDDTGEHGLVCPKLDTDGGSFIRWYAGTYTYTMARGDGPCAGELNTAIIIAWQGRGDGNNYAARMCNELQITEGGKTYGDWYLPSKHEMYLMYQYRFSINTTAVANGGSAFGAGGYWTSTEFDNNNAWIHSFNSGTPINFTKSFEGRMRAVRTF